MVKAEVTQPPTKVVEKTREVAPKAKAARVQAAVQVHQHAQLEKRSQPTNKLCNAKSMVLGSRSGEFSRCKDRVCVQQLC